MEGVTQSRSLAPVQTGYYYVQNGHSYKGDYNASGTLNLQGGSQTTTSYRSQAGLSLESSDGGFNQGSGSQGAFQNELNADARRMGVRSFLNYGFSSFDNGHEFSTERISYSWNANHSMKVLGSPYGDLEYVGYVLPVLSPELPVFTRPSSSDVLLKGARMFKAAAPTKPEAGLMQFMAETRQDIPRVIGHTFAKEGFNRQSAGNEYLNLEFGLIPTWSDLQKLSKSVLNVGTLLRQYAHNANRNVRRRRSLPHESSITELVGSPSYPLIGSFFDLSTAQLFWVPGTQLGVTSVTDVVHTDAWFSGSFTYYMNEGHSILDRLDRYEEQANHLLGTRFSADTFWELSPFSWLADWYSDTGLFISNVVALDSDELVMRYGYVMHETRATRTYLKVGLTPREGSNAPTTLRMDVDFVQKLRYRASPYGFGLHNEDLTSRQKAILGALGMTQGLGSGRL